jgi:hypothetical protein
MRREIEIQLSGRFRKCAGEFAARAVVTEDRIYNGLAAEGAREESLKNGGCGAIGDVERHRAATDIDNDDRFSGGNNGPNEIVLVARKIKTGAESALSDSAANAGTPLN